MLLLQVLWIGAILSTGRSSVTDAKVTVRV